MQPNRSRFPVDRPHRLIAAGWLLALCSTTLLVSPIKAQGGKCQALLDLEAAICGPIKARPQTVSLDSTGIGDWSFLNPRSPKNLFPKLDKAENLEAYGLCLGRSGLLFDATGTDRSFLVTIAFDIERKRKSVSAIVDELKTVREKFDVFSAAIQARKATPGDQRPPLLEEDRAYLERVLILLEAKMECMTERSKEDAPEEDALPDKESLSRAANAKRTAGELVSGAIRESPSSLSLSAGEKHRCAELDDRVASIPSTEPLSSQDLAIGLQDLKEALDHVRGHLHLLMAPQDLPDFDPDQNCKPKDNKLSSCKMMVPVIGFNSHPLIGVAFEVLAGYRPQGVMEFSVSFLDQQEAPANSTGYVQVAEKIQELPSRFDWQAILGVGWTRDPQVDPDPTDDAVDKITVDLPYAGDDRNRFPASGRVDLSGWLSNRSRAKASLGWKGSDLGTDTDGNVKVSTWSGEVFTNRDFVFRFGSLKFATPSESIAVSARGEGMQLLYQRFALVHIVRQESLAGKADDDNQDSDMTLFQMTNLPLRTKLLRTLDALALVGEEIREHQTPYRHSTFGLEVRFAEGNPLCTFAPSQCKNQELSRSRTLTSYYADARPTQAKEEAFTAVFGSLAGYYSERQSKTFTPPTDDPDFIEIADGHGTAGLLTLSFNRLRYDLSKALPQLKPKFSLTLKAGYGTGDDPATPKNEGYLGETASFAPDRIFLSAFAGKIEDDSQSVAGGLSNKTYLAAFFTWHRAPFLEGIAKIFEDSPLGKPAMTFSAQHYRFNEAVFDHRDAGIELGVGLQGESPKGATVSISIAKFLAGDALEAFFVDDPWSLSAAVSLTIK